MNEAEPVTGRARGLRIENGLILAEFSETGELTRLFDKENGREAISPPRNQRNAPRNSKAFPGTGQRRTRIRTDRRPGTSRRNKKSAAGKVGPGTNRENFQAAGGKHRLPDFMK